VIPQASLAGGREANLGGSDATDANVVQTRANPAENGAVRTEVKATISSVQRV
jgi:hypothetical protein